MKSKLSLFGSDIGAEEITEAFEFFDDWEDRYAYIIDLGRKHPDYPDKFRTDENIVKGCQSQVWLHQLDADQNVFIATSDAHIVKGLLGIVLAAVNYKSSDDIRTFDFEAYFNTLGLRQHLSPTRSNGLSAMVQRIQAI